MREITFDGYHLPTLARLARTLDRPTSDAFADFIWGLSNSPSLPVQDAAEFMRESGYEPFVGFPLKHLNSKGARLRMKGMEALVKP